MPKQVQSILDALGLGNLTVSQLIGVIAIAAVLLLLGKTLVSAVLTKRMFHFLANRTADVAARLARAILSRQLLDVQRWSTSEVQYALTGGVQAAISQLLGAALIIASEVFLFAIMAIGLLIVDPLLTISCAMFFLIVVYILQVWLGLER
mgnify:CR=1 FL=1